MLVKIIGMITALIILVIVLVNVSVNERKKYPYVVRGNNISYESKKIDSVKNGCVYFTDAYGHQEIITAPYTITKR